MIDAAEILTRLTLGLGLLWLSGFVLAGGLAPGCRRLERAALSFGLGSLLLTLWMLALASLGLPLRLSLILPLPLALVAGAWAGRRILAGECLLCAAPAATSDPPSPTPARPPYGVWDFLFLSLLTALLLFALLRAVLYPVWAWDAISTWAFKGKVFYLRQTLDLSGFEAHNYYPNLVPLLLTYLYLWLGEVNDHLAEVVFPLAGLSLLLLLFGLVSRLGLSRPQALGVTAWFATGGRTLLEHLHIAYADLTLTYYTLGAAGLMYLWLSGRSAGGTLTLAGFFLAGMCWTKFEGPPLALTVLLAAALTLAWLRPKHLRRRFLALAGLGGCLILGYLPWRLFMWSRGIETGTDHILGFYPQQLLQAVPSFLWALVNPGYFGFLWPAAALALILCRKRLFSTPLFYLPLFLGGNFLAILLAYAVAPTAPFEFPLYVRATLDRLLLHLAPVAAVLLGEGVKELAGGPETKGAG